MMSEELDAERGAVSLGRCRTCCQVQQRVDREMTFGSPARWRIVLEDCLAELYLDDILVECFSLPASATGRIGLIDGGEPDTLRNLRKWK